MAATATKKNKGTKQACKYASKCYRKNQQHLQTYSHPDSDTEEDVVAEANLENNSGKKANQKRTIIDFFGASSKKTENASESDSEEAHPSKKMKVGSEASTESKQVAGQDQQTEPQGDESTEADEDGSPAAPVYPEDVRECIKETFLLEMPEDFYQFWDFCKACNKKDPSSALTKALELHLSGPFDILAGKHRKIGKNKHKRNPNFLLHQRFFYDPPEFQTVLVSDEASKFHIGYFRDDPKDMPVFMASNSPGESSSSKEKITQCGDNIFAAVHIYAKQKSKCEKGEKKKLIEQLAQSIEKEAKKLNLPLVPITKGMKERQKKVNCSTFHGAGMVVPVDANDVGYRPVPETQKDLRAMLKQMVDGDTDAQREQASDALQEIITFIQFANDECDYGEGLELGLCMFSFGRAELHPQISLLMPLAYMLLNRPQFQRIIEEHLKCRRSLGESLDELEK